MEDDAKRQWLGWETALGGLLVLLGTLVLLGQALQLNMGRIGWPFFVIVPGLGLLGLGLAAAGRLGEVLATVGGVVTMAGLVLLVQNVTDRFETWAYAWALVVLVGAGIGRWLVGVVRGRGDLATSGGWLIAAGLVAFLVFAVFFEGVVGIDGRRYGAGSRYGLAVLLILAGLVLVGRRRVGGQAAVRSASRGEQRRRRSQWQPHLRSPVEVPIHQASARSAVIASPLARTLAPRR